MMPASEVHSDRLLFVIDFWDVPIEGIATRDGCVIYFRALFDREADEYSGTYELVPLDDDTAAVAARASEQSRRFKERRTDSSLAAEHEIRMAELDSAIAREMQSRSVLLANARFVRRSTSKFAEDAFTVTWSDVK